MVGLGRGSRIEELKDKLKQLALASGVRAMFAEHSDELDEPFAEVVEELSNQYMIGFEPQRDGKWHRLEVQVPGRNYRVRARQGYQAPGGTSQSARPLVLRKPASRKSTSLGVFDRE